MDHWIQLRQLEAGSATVPNLFCLPHAGSGAAGFFRWRRALTTLNVCPIQLPGRDARMGEPALTDASEIVEQMHEALRLHLERPYALFGHSMGGLLAALWAQKIQQQGLPLPVALVISGRGAPSEHPVFPGLENMTDDAMLQALDARFGGGSVSTLLRDPELRAIYVPLLRADLTVVDSADRSRFVEPLRMPIHVLYGADDPAVPTANAERWRAHAPGACSVQRFPGTHFFHFNESETAVLDFLRTLASSSVLTYR